MQRDDNRRIGEIRFSRFVDWVMKLLVMALVATVVSAVIAGGLYVVFPKRPTAPAAAQAPAEYEYETRAYIYSPNFLPVKVAPPGPGWRAVGIAPSGNDSWVTVLWERQK